MRVPLIFSALGAAPCAAWSLPPIALRRVSVIGVGGAGVRIVHSLRALDRGLAQHTVGVDADARLLAATAVDARIFLNLNVPTFYDGGHLGVNEAAAVREIHALRRGMQGTEVGVLVAGLGGGTGSGASPVIAKTLKESGARVAAVVTLPFSFEGKRRQRSAEIALQALALEVREIVVYRNDLAAFGHSPQIRIGSIWALTDALMGDLIKNTVRTARLG